MFRVWSALFVVCCVTVVARCSLLVERWLSFVVVLLGRWLFFVVMCVLRGMCWLLFVSCRSSVVVCCVLFVA